MAWSRIAATATALGLTVTQSVTAGHLLVVYVAINDSTSDPTISDGVNTWTLLHAVQQDGTNAVGLKAWWAKAATTASITVTISSAPSTSNTIIAEWSGADSGLTTEGTPTGQTQQAPGTGTDGVTSGNTTPTTNGDLFVGMVVDGNTRAAAEYTAGTSFSKWGAASVDPGGAGNILCALEDWTQPSAAAHAATWTSADGDPSTSLVAAFKPAAAVASPGGSLTTLGVGA